MLLATFGYYISIWSLLVLSVRVGRPWRTDAGRRTYGSPGRRRRLRGRGRCHPASERVGRAQSFAVGLGDRFFAVRYPQRHADRRSDTYSLGDADRHPLGDADRHPLADAERYSIAEAIGKQERQPETEAIGKQERQSVAPQAPPVGHGCAAGDTD